MLHKWGAIWESFLLVSKAFGTDHPTGLNRYLKEMFARFPVQTQKVGSLIGYGGLEDVQRPANYQINQSKLRNVQSMAPMELLINKIDQRPDEQSNGE